MTTFHARRLPHYHCIGHPIFTTWRLHDSLRANRRFPSTTTAGQAFLAMDRISTPPTYLRRPEIVRMLVEAIHYREDGLKHYHLHNYVVMPNHVHLLITPRVEVSCLMQSLKRQGESYDRIVRGDVEFQHIAGYIEMNPVNAGIAATPEAFPWSSARADCQSAGLTIHTAAEIL